MSPISPDQALVVVVGVGGVGSHCAHALVRAGLRKFRLVDFDRVSLSSLNRHAVATRRDVGTPKVEACARHFADIAPGCTVDARDEMFTAGAAESLLGGGEGAKPDVVVDCIDDVPTKADLLSFCVEQGIPFISALGSGAKSDPTRMCVAKGLRDIDNDPLASKLRKVFPLRGTDVSGVSFVYSSQKPQRSLLPLSDEQRQNPEEFGSVANFRLRVIPVLGTQPAIAGVTLASQTMLELGIGRRFSPRPAPMPRRILVERYLEQLRKHSNGVDVTANEALVLVHEVWRARSALDTELALTGATGPRFTLTAFDSSRPTTIGNLLFVTEEEAKQHRAKGRADVAACTRQRIEHTLRDAAPRFAAPVARAPPAEPLPRPKVSRKRGAEALPVKLKLPAQPQPFDRANPEDQALVAEQLSRSSAFLGKRGHERIRGSRVVIIGVGTVGSATAALLVRAGVGCIRLVDGAIVHSGGNHMLARASDAGLLKVDSCRQSLADILPGAVTIETVPRYFNETSAESVLGDQAGKPDIVVDCTGDIASSVEVISHAVSREIRVISAIVSAGLVDTTRMTTSPLSEVHGNPVAVQLRLMLSANGFPSHELEKVDAIYSQEASHWLEHPAAACAGRIFPRLSIGLSAAAIVVHRLVGEVPPQADAPGMVSSWKKLRRALAIREGKDPGCKTLPSLPLIGAVAETIWRGRSALSRSGGDKPCEAAPSGLVIVRWDQSRPESMWNLVLLTEQEAEKHVAASAATGSLPMPLIEALGQTRPFAEAGEAMHLAPLVQQQMRVHNVLRRVKAHLEAAGGVYKVGASPPVAGAASRACEQVVRTRWIRGSFGFRRSLLTNMAVAGGALTVWTCTRKGFVESVMRIAHRNISSHRCSVLAAAFSAVGAFAVGFSSRSLRAFPKVPDVSRAKRKISTLCNELSLTRTASTPTNLVGVGLGGYAGLVGKTPVVELKSLSEATGCCILGKAEFLNPGGCQKDRVAQSIVEEAAASGLLRPGGTIVEGTSGSTGISLALAAASGGYRVHIVMPDDQASEKVQLLERFGAHVELVRPSSIANPDHYVNVARRRAVEICERDGPGAAIFADQFENVSNFNAHYRGTGPELWAQCGRQLDAFVMSAGTGGTIAGVARYLKEVGSEAKIYLADVQGSSLYNKVVRGVVYAHEQAEQGIRRHRADTIAEGIGNDRLTANFARGLPEHNGGMPGIDSAVRVSDQETLDMAHHLLKHDGLFVGSSAAVNCVAAVKLAKIFGPGRVIATVLCDGGQRHVTKFYNPAVWPSYGLKPPDVNRERDDLSFVVH